MIAGIARIDRLVEEFNIWELKRTPYGKFKVRVYQTSGEYIGYTNLQIRDMKGEFYAGVGHGSTVEEALKDTVEYFFKVIDEMNQTTETEFMYCDPNEF